MAIQINVGEPTAANRRVAFFLINAAGTAVTGEVGEQPQISINGGAFTDDGIGTLVELGNGHYYAELASESVASPAVIESRYKSDNTLEMPGATVQVKTIGTGSGQYAVSVSVVDGDDAAIGGGYVQVRPSGGGALVASARTHMTTGTTTLYLDAGDYEVIASGSASYTFPDNPQAFTVTGDQALTILGVALSVPDAPADPTMCAVYVDFRKVKGASAVAAGDATFTVKTVISRPSGYAPVLTTEDDEDDTDATAHCDATGRATANLARGGTYLISATWPGVTHKTVEVTVPDAETYDIGAVLQA